MVAGRISGGCTATVVDSSCRSHTGHDSVITEQFSPRFFEPSLAQAATFSPRPPSLDGAPLHSPDNTRPHGDCAAEI